MERYFACLATTFPREMLLFTVEDVSLDSQEQRATKHPTDSFQLRYRQLHERLVKILIQLDPLGVHCIDPNNLAPEATSILARMREARVADDVERIVFEELQRWYGRSHVATLDRDRLADATIAICTVWNQFISDAEP